MWYLAPASTKAGQWCTPGILIGSGPVEAGYTTYSW